MPENEAIAGEVRVMNWLVWDSISIGVHFHLFFTEQMK